MRKLIRQLLGIERKLNDLQSQIDRCSTTISLSARAYPRGTRIRMKRGDDFLEDGEILLSSVNASSGRISYLIELKYEILHDVNEREFMVLNK